MYSMTERLEHARKQRKEEQVVAAILHMSSPWGFFALISSGIVWAASKTRSRFLMVQALQAFLFQLFSFSAFGVLFLVFMIGFNYAAFSGLIARTGYTEPELTSSLIIAAIIGFAAIFFFQFIFPLWGIWAGIQVLRGRSFQYPILGKLVIKWTSHQPFVIKAEPHVPNSSNSDNGHVIAGVGHLAIFAQFSLFLSPILWMINKPRSRFLTHNLLQASIFQMTMTMVFVLLYFAVWGSGLIIGLLQMFGIVSPEFFAGLSELARITYFPFSFGIVFGLLLLASATYVIIAAIQAFRGKEFHYPFVGKWLLHYIQ
jgi:uncharacterized Tic20 family protein